MGDKERRKGKRIVITCVAEVTSLSTHQFIEGYVTNISREGLGLMARNNLEKEEDVMIKLSFFALDGVEEVENVRGKVKRVQSIADVYSIGIQFKSLVQKEPSKIFTYIDAAEKSL